MRRWLGLAFGLSSMLACLPEEEECFRASREVQADEVVRGQVVRELIAPYFGRYEGALEWQKGGRTALSLDLQDAPANLYNLYEVYECDPRFVSHWVSARVVSADGAFGDQIPAVIADRFPDSSLVPKAVVDLSTLPASEWNERVREHLSFDPSRYVESGLQFVLDWPAGDRAPAGGYLEFRGTQPSAPPLADTIRVGTLAF
jgi:hypothetical protein